MTCRIPSGTVQDLLACYRSLADQTYEIFGVNCDIFFLKDKIISVQTSGNNVPQINSINARRRSMPSNYDRDQQTIISQEVSEKVDLKIYWTAKEWKSVYGYTDVPENHVMFLAKIRDSVRLNKATKVRFTDIEGSVYIFTRVSNAIPYGFEKDRYCSSIWQYSR